MQGEFDDILGQDKTDQRDYVVRDYVVTETDPIQKAYKESKKQWELEEEKELKKRLGSFLG